MKKLYLLILFLTLAYVTTFAQSDAMEKLEAAKIALITERLELTPDQAEKFWPIYRQFAEEQKSLRSEFQTLKRGYDPSKATEEQNKQMLEEGMKIRERQLNLEKTYAQRMQEVITTRQLMSLRKAEDDFKEMLIKRIKEQQQQRQELQNQRQRNGENMRQRKN
ncbi:MAG: hypothetical protein CMB80_30495 [Flammeovirgaceae bacterium]|nr:hypothetical protein [Flammeovirgaceae bacterium]MBE60849.1 hypothetical protein [Flammeovirgaceae bacterium]